MIDEEGPCKSDSSVKLVRSCSIIIKNLTKNKDPGK